MLCDDPTKIPVSNLMEVHFSLQEKLVLTRLLLRLLKRVNDLNPVRLSKIDQHPVRLVDLKVLCTMRCMGNRVF